MPLSNRRPSLPQRPVTKWHRAMLARWAYDAMDRISYFSKNEALVSEANRYLEQRSWKDIPRSVLIDWADREFTYRKRKEGIPEEDDRTSIGREYGDEQLCFRSLLSDVSYSADKTEDTWGFIGVSAENANESSDNEEVIELNDQNSSADENSEEADFSDEDEGTEDDDVDDDVGDLFEVKKESATEKRYLKSACSNSDQIEGLNCA